MSASVYLVYGEDEYRVSDKARQIVDQRVPAEDRTFGLEVIDGRVDTNADAEQAMDRTLEALFTLGFLASRKTVWLRGATFLSEKGIARSELLKTRMGDLAARIKEGLPAGHALVLSAPRIDGRSALAKACKQVGEVHGFAVPEKDYLAERQAADTLKSFSEAIGLSMSRDAQAAFLEKVGTETRQMVSELEKLSAYVHPRRRVELADVEAVTSASRGAAAWDLADAFGKRDLPGALRVLRRLLFCRESPIGLIMGLEGRIRDLMVYREAMERGWLEAGGQRQNAQWIESSEAEEIFGGAFEKDPRGTHPYRVGLLAGQAGLFSRLELERALAAVSKTHRELVSSSVPQGLLLELLLLKLLGGRGSAARAGSRRATPGP